MTGTHHTCPSIAKAILFATESPHSVRYKPAMRMRRRDPMWKIRATEGGMRTQHLMGPQLFVTAQN